MIRKDFLKSVGFGSMFLTIPQLVLSKEAREMDTKSLNEAENYFEDELINAASIIPPDEGERLHLNGITVTFKVTSGMSNNQLGVYEIVLPPKTIGAKLHYHRFMDETFIVKEGMLSVEVGDTTQTAEAGTVVYVPRFTPHGFRNDSNAPVKVLLIFNPAEKREGFFKGLHQTLSETPVNPQKFLKLYNKYDSFPVDVSDMVPSKN